MTRTSRWMVVLALLAVCIEPVQASHPVTTIYKCNAKVFQDHPCPEASAAVTPPVAEHKKAYDEVALERKLDQLQAMGVGLIQPALPKVQPPPSLPKPKDHDFYKPQPRSSWMARLAQEQLTDTRLQRQAEHNNAVSAAKLGQIIEQQEAHCGGKLQDLPIVGMSDQEFRQCTILARFGHITQIVASEDDGVPLRLYVFPTAAIRRVYSIDGVVTAVKP